jgi:hypothetical protein
MINSKFLLNLVVLLLLFSVQREDLHLSVVVDGGAHRDQRGKSHILDRHLVDESRTFCRENAPCARSFSPVIYFHPDSGDRAFVGGSIGYRSLSQFAKNCLLDGRYSRFAFTGEERWRCDVCKCGQGSMG